MPNGCWRVILLTLNVKIWTHEYVNLSIMVKNEYLRNHLDKDYTKFLSSLYILQRDMIFLRIFFNWDKLTKIVKKEENYTFYGNIEQICN